MQYTWPKDLPRRPISSDYVRTLPLNSISFEMETGPSKPWRVSSSNPQHMELGYVLRERYQPKDTGEIVNQKKLFCDFWEIVDANRYFWLPDPEDETQEIYVRIKGGNEKKGPPIKPLAFKVWKTTFTVEVAPLVPPRHINQ